MRKASLLVFAGLLASCQTNEQYQAQMNADLDARLTAYNGSTIAEFIERTGMLPEGAYPVAGGRVFVFRTSPVFITFPATNVAPAVTRSAQCQLLIQAVPDGTGRDLDSWRITGNEHTGPCNNLLV